jgi:diguanylate cyclase (GGDEF)-like protein
MVWLTSRLGIHPVLNAVDRIKSNSPIPEVGANEFRYLARAYNKMYEVYKNSLARLNFKASHDELTGAYNRAGYDLLLSSIDLNNTYMMLFDVDNFKTINDTYGHEIGDKALIKLVKVLRSNFRSDDYICRIGGDEFVVFMVHTAEMQHNLLAQKMDEINRELAETDDGVPAISISVGIMDGKDAADTETLYKKADEAMYESKKNGKHTYTFYHGK